jgi:hypothetical protein
MSSAWEKVFPEGSIMHDFFHLQQANTRKMAKIGLSELKDEVKDGIRTLWYADTKEEFDAHLETFRSHLSTQDISEGYGSRNTHPTRGPRTLAPRMLLQV